MPSSNDNREHLRTVNLVGALAVAFSDRIRSATEEAMGQGAAAPAAIVQIGTNAGESIDALSRTLALSHSATVRIVERLQSDGLVKKIRGTDARVSELTLTAAGRRAMADVLAGRQDVISGALSSLTRTDWSDLTRLVEKILPNLVDSRAESDYACRLCDESSCPQSRCPADCDAE